jgi:hypothetical protein
MTAPANPAELFIELWHDVAKLSGFERNTAAPPVDFEQQIHAALAADDGAAASAACIDLLAGKTHKAERHGKMLAAMAVIDEYFELIHPRSRIFSPGTASRLPAWLGAMRDTRRMHGHYASDKSQVLIARGPLQRGPRDEHADYAENLAARFSALTLAPTTLKLQQRHLRVRHLVIGRDLQNGVQTGRAMTEQVLLVPVAEAADDLQLSRRDIRGQPLLAVHPAPTFAPADKLLEQIKKFPGCDIAVAPELVLPEPQAEALAEGLPAIAAPRITVAGSGASRAQKNGQPYNQSTTFNAVGKALWQQRKCWIAGIDERQALAYGLGAIGDKLLMEDNAESSELVIADIDSLGRCVVLICQDLQAQPTVAELLSAWEPDWVFCPILDQSIDPGRWAHQAALGYSGLSNARFVTVTSTTLARRTSKTGKIPYGMAVGPKAATLDNHDDGRAAIATADAGATKVTWGDSWPKTKLAID